MADMEYSIAYSEVLEILKYISEEDYNKIPKEKIDLFKEYASKEYVFKYNPTMTLDEQNVSKIAKGIIAILFRDYWSTPSQREKIVSKQKNDRIEIEKEKSKRYETDIFNVVNNKRSSEVTSLAKLEKQKWYKRLFLFIKNMFK